MWRIPSLVGGEEGRSSASLEFSIPYEGDISVFFPIQISFTSPESIPGFQVFFFFLLFDFVYFDGCFIAIYYYFSFDFLVLNRLFFFFFFFSD